MSKPDQSEVYTEEETAARREAALKFALTAPHKPHTPIKGKRVESRGK